MIDNNMKKVVTFYIEQFKIIIDRIASNTENKIIVLRGVPDLIKENLSLDVFADIEGFNKEDSLDFFNKKWFSKVFIELNKEKKYHILSFSQFSNLTEYMIPDFFKDRIIIIQDNLRQIFPLEKSYYRLKSGEENIEERDEKLPLHHVEQFQIDEKYYYISKDLLFNFETINAFDKSKEIKNNDNSNIEIIDITIDIYAIDMFVNQCIESDSFNKYIAIKFHEKKERNTEIIQTLLKLNAVMSVFGGEVFIRKQEEIYDEYVENEETIKILKKYWGKDAYFRNLSVYRNPDISQDVKEISQGKIVETIISEYLNAKADKPYRDLFLTAPTGAGKSLLFQLPAFYISDKHDVTIVVSPLIALMKDQVSAIVIDRKFEKVAYVNSELSLIDRDRLIDQCKRGEIDILYLSPELLLSYNISHFIGERKLGLLVIDEAHLITTWGRDFRVDYWFLGNHIRKIRKYSRLNFPMVAVTATAIYGGTNDMVFDSIDSLVMNNPHIYIGIVRRDDIVFLVNNYDKFPKNYEKCKLDQTVDFIDQIVKSTNLKTLVYAPYSRHVRKINEVLMGKNLDFASFYYGALDKDIKEQSYNLFLHGEKQIMISTKAFGMGIDIPDIQVVYHHAPSGLLPDYIQEIGRLARDSKLTGYAALNYSEQDKSFSNALYGMSAIKPYQLVEMLKKILASYKQHKSQNLLLSVDDFAYIFEDRNDIDQKVLTSLMMIEKDYLNKYRINVLIARPKKLFVKVYGRATNEDAAKIIEKYGKSVKQIPYKTLENKGYKILNIDLDQIWKDYFANQSFPKIKAQFYNNKIFNDVSSTMVPQLKISFVLNKSASNVSSNLETNFSKIKNAFASIGGSFFCQDELILHLNNEFKDEYLSMKVGMFLLSNYSGILNNTFKFDDNVFLARKLSDKDYKYRLISSLYIREFSNLIQRFNLLFSNNNSYESFRYVTNNDEASLTFTRLGYFLELFELGTFEIKGGENPMIFIRINDIHRIERDTKQKYSNFLLKKTLDKHFLSNKIFDHFFMNSFTNDERWLFIEDFFLGTDIDDLIEKYPRNQITPRIDIIKYLEENAKASKDFHKSKLCSNAILNFSPDNNVFYTLNTMLTIVDNENTKTLKVSKWIIEDPIKFDMVRRENDLKIDKEVFKILISKLRKYPDYFRDSLGLNYRIEFDGYEGLVKAFIPYQENPIKFYKWWLTNKSVVKMNFKEKMILFNNVNYLDQDALQVQHKKMLNK